MLVAPLNFLKLGRLLGSAVLTTARECQQPHYYYHGPTKYGSAPVAMATQAPSKTASDYVQKKSHCIWCFDLLPLLRPLQLPTWHLNSSIPPETYPWLAVNQIMSQVSSKTICVILDNKTQTTSCICKTSHGVAPRSSWYYLSSLP